MITNIITINIIIIIIITINEESLLQTPNPTLLINNYSEPNNYQINNYSEPKNYQTVSVLPNTEYFDYMEYLLIAYYFLHYYYYYKASYSD